MRKLAFIFVDETLGLLLTTGHEPAYSIFGPESNDLMWLILKQYIINELVLVSVALISKATK